MFPNVTKIPPMFSPDMVSMGMYPGCMCILFGKANRWCVSMSNIYTTDKNTSQLQLTHPHLTYKET